MTKLQKDALGRGVLPPSRVLAIAQAADRHPLADRMRDIRRLCESHERLRMELEGATELLADGPPDDAASVTAEWLASVVPGFAASDSGVAGAMGDDWRVIAYRKPSGWAFVVSGDGCEASRICPTRGEARSMLRLFGIPLTEAAR